MSGLALGGAYSLSAGDPSSAYSGFSGASAYSESPTLSEGSQPSSLATMPYAEEPTSTPISRPGFGAPSMSFASLPTSDTYSMTASDSYTTESASQPLPQARGADGYASLASDQSAGSYDSYLAESDGVASGYSYDPESEHSTPTVHRSHSNSPAPQPLRTSTPSSSEPSGQPIKTSGRNWTRDFYTVQSTISKGGSLLNPVEVMTQLSSMTAQFTEDAVKYGSIIIREQMLPPAKKSIKPASVGGVAGGQKFVYEGIFFKFPTDDVGLYGNLENAMRGAGHELKGLTALINWELKTIGLHAIKFPLTAIIDYYGYRLVATAVLPLSGKTMCIGSGDAGRTILDGTESHQREPARRLAQLLADWGKFINVAPHDFQSTSLNRRIANVKICFDLEGHIGTDGNYYLCDFARTFPPADPMGVSGRFLYRLLRPEFVKKYRRAISSDSFMSMQVDKSLNNTTKDASKHLMTEWIIEAVKVWNKTVNCVLPPNVISLLAHQSGINLRFLRLVAAVVTDFDLKKAVNVEIVARTLKSVIRNEIREIGRLEDEDILAVITKYFNLTFSDTDESAEFWQQDLQREILKRFDTPTSSFFDLADEILSAPGTPSGSPAPSRSSSLLNSASQDSDSSSSLGPHSPSLGAKSPSRSKSSIGSRSRGKKPVASKAAPSEDVEADEVPSPAKRTKSKLPVTKSKDAPSVTVSKPAAPQARAAPSTQAATAPRRSSRVPKPIANPEPIPQWILDMEEDDDEYVPSDSSSEEEEAESSSDDASGDEELIGFHMKVPQYESGYSGDITAYGEDMPEVDEDKPKAKPKPRTKSKNVATPPLTSSTSSAKKSRSKKPLESSQEFSPSITTNYADAAEVLGDSANDSPTPPMTPLRTSVSSNSSTPLLKTPSGLGITVRVDRNLGILRHQVHLEMLYARMQQLLGCFFGTTGDAKFQAVMMHHNGDVKSKFVRVSTVSKFGLSSASGSGVSHSASARASSSPSPSPSPAPESQTQEEVIEITAVPRLGLSPRDVDVYRPRIKQMFLTPFQVAFSLKKEADETEDFDRREELLRRASEAYLECLERNPLGDFALHNASRVLLAWLPFFPEANSNDAKCVAYLAKRFAVLAEKENRDLAKFKADIYKTSDMIEPRTGKVLTANQPDWSSDSLIRNLVLRKTELAEMVADILSSAQPSEDPDANSDVELRMALRDCYDVMFDEFAVDGNAAPSSARTTPKKTAAKKTASTGEMVVERKVALQYWKMIVAVIHPSNPEMLDKLVDGLGLLPKSKAFLAKHHWDHAASFIF